MFGSSKKKFDASKFRAQCQLACVRIRLQKQKKQNMSQSAKREIADLIRAGDESTAQVKTEQLMHDDYVCEALDILETQLNELSIKSLVVANTSVGAIPPDLLEILATVIYAAPRLSIPEFAAVRDQLGIKFGRQFVFDCANDKDHCVQANVKAKLTMGSGPDHDETVYFYMKSICELYGVPFNREIIGDAPADDGAAALGFPSVPGAAADDGLPPPLTFGDDGTAGGVSPFPTVPGAGAGAPSPFPTVPGAAGGAPSFASVPGAGAGGAPSPFPSVPGAGGGAPSPFPSVPGAGGGAPSPFPSVPGGAPSPFPSVPGGAQPAASAFPSVPGGGSRVAPSAFPSVPGGAGSSSSAPRAAPSPFPSTPAAGGAPQAGAPDSFGMPGDDALMGLPDENQLPDFDDLEQRMEALRNHR